MAGKVLTILTKFGLVDGYFLMFLKNFLWSPFAKPRVRQVLSGNAQPYFIILLCLRADGWRVLTLNGLICPCILLTL
jgi:hypothetical protein